MHFVPANRLLQFSIFPPTQPPDPPLREPTWADLAIEMATTFRGHVHDDGSYDFVIRGTIPNVLQKGMVELIANLSLLIEPSDSGLPPTLGPKLGRKGGGQ
jgi:hypothetical protein